MAQQCGEPDDLPRIETAEGPLGPYCGPDAEFVKGEEKISTQDNYRDAEFHRLDAVGEYATD